MVVAEDVLPERVGRRGFQDTAQDGVLAQDCFTDLRKPCFLRRSVTLNRSPFLTSEKHAAPVDHHVATTLSPLINGGQALSQRHGQMARPPQRLVVQQKLPSQRDNVQPAASAVLQPGQSISQTAKNALGQYVRLHLGPLVEKVLSAHPCVFRHQ
ncbi:hypothetical protein SHIRM173S_10247 [Streptomyces hirsutus]